MALQTAEGITGAPEEEEKAWNPITGGSGEPRGISRETTGGALYGEEATVFPDEIDDKAFTLDGEGVWQYEVMTREMTGVFHWKTRNLKTGDIVRFIIRLRKTPRSPGGILGKNWPKEIYVRVGNATFAATKKADWFPGSPRKYWAPDVSGKMIGEGEHYVEIRAAPDTWIKTSCLINVEKGVRGTGGAALSIAGLGGGLLLVGIIVVGVAMILMSPGGRAASAGGM